MNLAFTPTGWDDLNYWADRDRATCKKVRALLKEVVCISTRCFDCGKIFR